MEIISNGQKTRPLTEEEKNEIESYELDSKVKLVIGRIWGSKTEPVIEKKEVRISILWFMLKCIWILLPFVLCLEFFDPKGMYLQPYIGENAAIYIQAIHRLGMFLLWVTTIVLFIAFLLQIGLIISIKEDKSFIWKQNYLSAFKKKNVIIKHFFQIIAILVGLGLILNVYYFTASIYIIALILYSATYNDFKKKVKKEIDNQISQNI